jgi:putative membrane protein
MKKFIYPVLGLALALSVQSCIDNEKAKIYQEKTLIDDGGVALIRNGLEGGLTEIKASTLAEANSKNPRIVDFAKMIIADHTKADSALKAMEYDKMLTEKDTISGVHEAAIDSLAKQTGTEFDKSYIEMMVRDHESAIDLFTDQSNDKNKTIQDFARQTLPTLEAHLDSAKAIGASLK